MIYVLTYATHSYGNFDKMIDNEYGVQFIILGWGKKWTGYMGKLRMIYDYCKKLKKDDIVIQLDGFDVWINNYLSEAIKIFKYSKYKVLFSKDPTGNLMGLQTYATKKIFKPTCNDTVINAGMYMGKVEYLLPIFEEALKINDDDDQRIFNLLCGKFKNIISIDERNAVFENVSSIDEIQKSKSVFVQYPGKPSIQRYARGIKEYGPYLYQEIIVILITFLIFLIILSYYYYHMNIKSVSTYISERVNYLNS